MNQKGIVSFAVTIIVFSTFVYAEKKSRSVEEMNLKEFMEEYTKPATKLYEKQDNVTYLNQILEAVPAMAPEADRAAWKEIVDAKLAVGKPDETCKSCHTKFKKEYKSQYRKRLVVVPEALKQFPSEMKQLLAK